MLSPWGNLGDPSGSTTDMRFLSVPLSDSGALDALRKPEDPPNLGDLLERSGVPPDALPLERSRAMKKRQ